jgi:maltose O-acetyltransferase
MFKTQRELMVAGEYYNATDPELVNARHASADLQFRINSTMPSDKTQMALLFRQLIGCYGDNFHITPPFRCDYGFNITLGERFYANFGCTILDVAPVTIGDDVMFGPSVQIITATHPIDSTERISGLEYAKPITIGSKTWLGAGVIVCPGVTIGEGCVIGAGSVVVKDIPAYSVAVGNPCRVIRACS